MAVCPLCGKYLKKVSGKLNTAKVHLIKIIERSEYHFIRVGAPRITS